MPTAPPSPYSQSDLKRYYRESLPFLFWLTSVALLLIALAIAVAGIWSAYFQQTVFRSEALVALGQQGDFFGGHFSAILGLVTIVFVIASFLLERQRARRSALRDTFLRGVDQITEARRNRMPDTEENKAVDPIALRLVNYYARVALANPDEDELLVILNVPVTGALRTAVEEDAEGQNNYPFAVQALQKFRHLETQMHREKKGLPERP